MSDMKEGSQGSDAMEEEADDDFYGAGDAATAADSARTNDVKMETTANELEEGEEESSEEEEDEDDLAVDLGNDDFQPTPAPTSRYGTQYKQESASAQPGRPQPQQAGAVRQTSAAPQLTPSSSQHGMYAPPDLVLRDGRTYPEVHTSKIIVTGDPEYHGKKISELEIDADLAEHMKPWRAPGADQSDYFNYGFDEFTWAQYVMRQVDMEKVLESIKDQQHLFDNMLQGMGMPGMPGGGSSAPAGAPTVSAGNGTANGGTGAMGMGMPNENEMMAAMQQMMAQQGISDPTQIDFGAFMQQMGGFGGPPSGPSGNVPSGPSGWQQGGGAGGGRGGRGNRRW